MNDLRDEGEVALQGGGIGVSGADVAGLAADVVDGVGTDSGSSPE